MTTLSTEQQQDGASVPSTMVRRGGVRARIRSCEPALGGEGFCAASNPADRAGRRGPSRAPTGPVLAVTESCSAGRQPLSASATAMGPFGLRYPANPKAVGAPLSVPRSARPRRDLDAFSPDGNCSASVRRRRGHRARLWNPVHRQLSKPLPAGCRLCSSTLGATAWRFSPTGKLLAIRQRRRNRVAVEPGHRAARRIPIRLVPASARPRGVQPGRRAAGHRRRRWDVRLWNPCHRSRALPSC